MENIYTNILHEELIVASGCTEPIAIALASAKCREVLSEFPESITLNVSGNIIKNVQGVIIPGTKTLRGVELSAILGAVVGESKKQLEILKDLGDDQIEQALALKEKNICNVIHKKGNVKLYIEVPCRR